MIRLMREKIRHDHIQMTVVNSIIKSENVDIETAIDKVYHMRVIDIQASYSALMEQNGIAVGIIKTTK